MLPPVFKFSFFCSFGRDKAICLRFLDFFCCERLTPSSKNENPDLHIYMRKCNSISISIRKLRRKWFKKRKSVIPDFEILAPTPQAASTFLLMVFHILFLLTSHFRTQIEGNAQGRSLEPKSLVYSASRGTNRGSKKKQVRRGLT